MESPGEIIREARRRRGLSPEEVFRLARVRPGLLESIEEDVLTALPEDPYARGLYATLARTVGADLERVLAAYDHVRSTRTVLAFDSSRVAEPPRRRGRPVGLFIALAAAVLLVGLVWIGSERGRAILPGGKLANPPVNVPAKVSATAETASPQAGPGEVPAALPAAGLALVAAPQAAAPHPADSSLAEDEVPPPPTEVKERPRDPNAVKIQRVAAPREGDVTGGLAPGSAVQPLDSDLPTLPGINAPEVELVLEVTAVRKTWMRVVIDAQRTRSGILPVGETRTWRGRNELRLDVNDVGDVRVRLNGRPVDVGEPRQGQGHFLLGWDQTPPPADEAPAPP